MTGVEVRLAQVGDVEQIVRLEREVETAPHWADGVYREIVVGDGTRCLYVAWRGGVVGFAVGRVVAGIGEIESVAVEVAEHGRGIGRALLAAVMEWCVAAGAGEIELEVRDSGAAARRLYERTGFVEMGRRAGYYSGPAEDAILMRWKGSERAASASNDSLAP